MKKDFLIILALTVGLSAGLNIGDKYHNGETGDQIKKVVYNSNNSKYINNNIHNKISNSNIDLYIINTKEYKLKSYNLIIKDKYRSASRDRKRVLNTASVIAYKIKMVESHGKYKARSKWSDACGAYQYISTTWNNFMGYSNACKAPASVQDQRIIKDLEWRYKKYGDWEKVIASHYYPKYANDKTIWYKRPTPNQPTMQQYVNIVMKIKL